MVVASDSAATRQVKHVLFDMDGLLLGASVPQREISKDYCWEMLIAYVYVCVEISWCNSFWSGLNLL